MKSENIYPFRKARSAFANQSLWLTAPTEINHLLRTFSQQCCYLQMSLAGHMCMAHTVILEIDFPNRCLYLGMPFDGHMAGLAVPGKVMWLETCHEGITVRFRVTIIERTWLQGNPALQVTMPTQVLRLQRRDNFRIRTKGSYIWLNGRDEARSPRLKVYNLSVGGLAVLDTAYQLPVEDNSSLTCWLMLPNLPLVTTELSVRHIQESTTPCGLKSRLVGMAFTQLTASQQALIQRYIHYRERSHDMQAGNELIDSLA